MENMQNLLMEILKCLVDKPEDIKINELSGESSIIMELTVSKEDVGKVIGKGGKTADAIRTIMYCAAAKRKKRYTLQILEK